MDLRRLEQSANLDWRDQLSFLKDTHSVPTRLVAHLLIFTLAYTPIFGAMNGTAAFAQAVQTTTNKFEYDAQGNLKRITDPLSRVTDLTYDPLRRLTLAQLPPPVVGAVRPTIQYGYDGLDFLSTVKDPRQLTTSYTVNGFGNTEAVISPDTGTTTQAFNAGTNTVMTAKDADARLFTLSNDLGGRVKSITFLSGVPTTFEYDGGATPVVMAKGALTKMTDESGTTLYTYSAFGELASKSQTVTAAGVSKTHVVSYVYGSAGSANGKVSSMTYPSGSRKLRLRYSWQSGLFNGQSCKWKRRGPKHGRPIQAPEQCQLRGARAC
ncbi:hypothetical protein LP419_31390 [Massilia sp. H-1]|nr:hypothetical protein LP419_31390 [Massilia sp. H-1]